MKKKKGLWACDIAYCDYIYNPETGDPDHGIKPGNDFQDLPEDWVCPKCGAEKQYFEKLD